MAFRRPHLLTDALVVAEMYQRAVAKIERAEKAHSTDDLLEHQRMYWQTFDAAEHLLEVWMDAMWLPHDKRQRHQKFAYENSLLRLDAAVRLYGSALPLCFYPEGRELGVSACTQAKRAAVDELVFIGALPRLRQVETLKAQDQTLSQAATPLLALQDAVYQAYATASRREGTAGPEVEGNTADPTLLASGDGYVEGVLEHEHYPARVEAHESALVVLMGGAVSRTFPYSAVAWFRIGPVPEPSWASDLLGAGRPVVWLSVADGAVEDRWRLALKSDDLERWRVSLEYFGIRDAAKDKARAAVAADALGET